MGQKARDQQSCRLAPCHQRDPSQRECSFDRLSVGPRAACVQLVNSITDQLLLLCYEDLRSVPAGHSLWAGAAGPVGVHIISFLEAPWCSGGAE